MEIPDIHVGDALWYCRPAEITYEGSYDKFRPARVEITMVAKTLTGTREDIWGRFEDGHTCALYPQFLFRDLALGWAYIRASLLEVRAGLVRDLEGTLESIDADLRDWVGKP